MSHYGEIERLASDNFGYFTSSAAREVGVLSCELDRWVKMGRIESSARGVYRLSNYPLTPQDAYMAGVLSVGPNAYVYGASVLALLNLVPTDPTQLFIATTRRSRRKLASSLVVVPGGRDDRISNYGGVPAQTLEDAIRVSRGYVRHDRRLRAVEEGVRQGYLMKSVGQKLVRELKHEATADQIAQKLHGATDPQYCRAQDLIDLQLMLSREKVDYAEVRDICKRLFANRRHQPWPSKVVATEEWRIAYDRTKGTLPVLPTIDEAVAWANDLIDAIDKSKSKPSKKNGGAK